MLSIAIKFSFYPEKEKNLLRFCSEQLFKVARAWNVDRLISRKKEDPGSFERLAEFSNDSERRNRMLVGPARSTVIPTNYRDLFTQ